MRPYASVVALTLVFIAPLAGASPEAKVRAPRRRPPILHRSSGVSQRKRLNVNNLIAAPGTVEVDWGSLYSYTSASLSLPSAVRYTPDGDALFVGRTEYSVAFDSFASDVNDGVRSAQFSDRLTFQATTVVYASDHFAIAFAPQVVTLLRGDSGVRLGATTIARYDGGGNTIAGTASWTGATTASDTNPSGTWDFGAGFGRQLAQNGILSLFTPHLNFTLEKSTGFGRTLAGFGGIAYQLTPRVSIDFSGQRLGLNGAGDRQVLVGLTISLGKMMPSDTTH